MSVKLTKEIKDAAAKIFADNDAIQTLFVNDKGEFFTSRNLADNSVSKPKEEVAEIARATVVTDEEGTPAKAAKTSKAQKDAAGKDKPEGGKDQPPKE
ncbi:MAG: hypothetical protein JNM71_12755 [Flavobacterium lindanitolerans]|uniref:hypothetical protein n=1 Tax=Flavobacterium lindanitolerans TaxID=428988 RepID=UPI001A391348|nr:hypothetical protein [Flavobacterium lindanitolerans]MBL7868877.1 hypothetical protein [Flavobacterium lindanitolerans]